jgi:hypothetical protein
MNWLRAAARRWGISILIACAILGFAFSIIAGAYLLTEQRKQNTRRLDQERRLRMANEERRRFVDAQIRFTTYVLCRSSGRTPKECNRIANGTILPPNLTLDQIEARFARIAEIQVQRIFVKGKPGLSGERGSAGARGARGAQGSRGATGIRGSAGRPGAKGERGEKGERGAPGQRGAQGERGVQGIQGIQGIQGPSGAGGSCVWVIIRIPSSGEYTVCTKG